ncbi:MAG: hypothetical protein R3174_13115 [Gammaproteobacteria bacterium]|nr:hypothetical protein [Gammaproteobacteria bacterium]
MQRILRLLSLGRYLPVILLLAGAWPPAVVAEPIIFRGEFVYVVPENMADKMTELASKSDWKHFPSLTRYVDTDEDGSPDYVAIALGAEGGYGAQIRYRLSFPGAGTAPRLGLWYWCVITDDTGSKIFEEFNP